MSDGKRFAVIAGFLLLFLAGYFLGRQQEQAIQESALAAGPLRLVGRGAAEVSRVAPRSKPGTWIASGTSQDGFAWEGGMGPEEQERARIREDLAEVKRLLWAVGLKLEELERGGGP